MPPKVLASRAQPRFVLLSQLIHRLLSRLSAAALISMPRLLGHHSTVAGAELYKVRMMKIFSRRRT